MSEPTVAIDLDLCNGYANCVLVAPEVFDINDKGQAMALVPRPAGEQLTAAEEAVRGCPVQAITLTEG